MIQPVNDFVIISVEKPPEEQDGFVVGNTNKYERLNRGEITQSSSDEWKTGVRVFFQDFQGVEIDKNLIVLHKDDIVAFEKE